MIYAFDLEEHIGAEKIAEHSAQAVLIADRVNDRAHRDPSPEWVVDRIELKAPWSGKWVELPKEHRLHRLAVNALYRQTTRIETAWSEFLAAEEQEYGLEVV